MSIHTQRHKRTHACHSPSHRNGSGSRARPAKPEALPSFLQRVPVFSKRPPRWNGLCPGVEEEGRGKEASNGGAPLPQAGHHTWQRWQESLSPLEPGAAGRWSLSSMRGSSKPTLGPRPSKCTALPCTHRDPLHWEGGHGAVEDGQASPTPAFPTMPAPSGGTAHGLQAPTTHSCPPCPRRQHTAAFQAAWGQTPRGAQAPVSCFLAKLSSSRTEAVSSSTGVQDKFEGSHQAKDGNDSGEGKVTTYEQLVR